jgi:hypothetical protein
MMPIRQSDLLVITVVLTASAISVWLGLGGAL